MINYVKFSLTHANLYGTLPALTRDRPQISLITDPRTYEPPSNHIPILAAAIADEESHEAGPGPGSDCHGHVSGRRSPGRRRIYERHERAAAVAGFDPHHEPVCYV